MITFGENKEKRKSSHDEIKITANALITKYSMLADEERLSGKVPVCINIESLQLLQILIHVYKNTYKHDLFLHETISSTKNGECARLCV